MLSDKVLVLVVGVRAEKYTIFVYVRLGCFCVGIRIELVCLDKPD
jgi:hypothetical protein